MPPEIQAWIQQGASGLTQLIPPGLLPPGMVPGAPAAAPAPAPDAPRFHQYRIVAQTQVIDPELKEELGKMLGDPDNFSTEDARCAPGVIYPETGISFSSGPGAPANDILISLACNQIVSRSFAWPHPATGMTHGGNDDLRAALMKIFPAGS
jgi:hypothetical protein